MNWLVCAVVAAVVGVIVIAQKFPADNWREEPPFTYVPPQFYRMPQKPPQPPCKAVREAEDIAYACWSEEVQ